MLREFHTPLAYVKVTTPQVRSIQECLSRIRYAEKGNTLYADILNVGTYIPK